MRNYHDWQKQYPHQAVLIERCAEAIRQVVPDAEVILYGSVARGEAHADSDIDLLVLVQQEVTPQLRQAVRGQLYEIALESDQIITSIVRQQVIWHSEPLNYTPLYDAIINEGVAL